MIRYIKDLIFQYRIKWIEKNIYKVNEGFICLKDGSLVTRMDFLDICMEEDRDWPTEMEKLRIEDPRLK